MRTRLQVGMVLNLDKCIGCHTCSMACKNVWINREGMEYARFNNTESRPGVNFPNDWEDQGKWEGGWIHRISGKLQSHMGSRAILLGRVLVNPRLPGIDDYYEPFDCDYQNLHNAPENEHQPIARPCSPITGQRMDRIVSGPNWKEIPGGEFERRAKDQNFNNIQKAMCGQFEDIFMAYLPHLCEHCLNPTCVVICPSGTICKCEEDNIILIGQDKCRGWRMCIIGCPYKKIHFNWENRESEKCALCYSRTESGVPTVCFGTCVDRVHHSGALLYDVDAIENIASTESKKDLYRRRLDMFLDSNDPRVIGQVLKSGIPQGVIETAQQSPVYKMTMDRKLALPLHPEYHTLSVVRYVPPLSPIQPAVDADELGSNGTLPDVENLHIPVRYLADLPAVGDIQPILLTLKRMLTVCHYKRTETVGGVVDIRALEEVGLSEVQTQEMYRYLAITSYGDRFVVPNSHREQAREVFLEKSGCDFSFGDGCHDSDNQFNLFNSRRIDAIDVISKTEPHA